MLQLFEEENKVSWPEPADISKQNVPDELLADFRNFLYIVWTKALRLPEPSPLQYSIAFALQHRYGPSADDLIRRQIQALRGAGKTYILCAWAVWLLIQNPERKIMYITSNAEKAKDAVVMMMNIIRALDFLHYLLPQDKQRDGAQRFDVGCCAPAKDASVMAASYSGALTGYHPDDLISDDIETSENAITAGGRERLARVMAEYESMVNPGGSITILGTPHTPMSVYIRIKDQYRLRQWPAEYPDPDAPSSKYVAEDVIETVRRRPDLISQPTYPERFDVPQLQEKLAVYGAYYYNLQMLLRTDVANEDRYPLKLRNLIVYDCDSSQAPSSIVWGTQNPVPIQSEGLGTDDRLFWAASTSGEFMPYERRIMTIDPSGGGDKVGYAVLKTCQGTIYCTAAGALPGGHSDVTLTQLARIAKQHDVQEIIVESNYGDGLYEKALAPLVAREGGAIAIRGVKVSQQKERRICDILEPVTGSHRLVIDSRVANIPELMSQYAQITRERGSLAHDDIIDALATGVSELSDVVQLDTQRLAGDRDEQERRESAEDTVRSYYRANPAMLAHHRSHKAKERQGRAKRRRSAWTRGGSERRKV